MTKILNGQIKNSFGSKMKIKNFLLNSGEAINDLLRVIDNPKRFEILVHLLDTKEHSFSNLMEETSLQKSALSNHLATLSDKNLIDKKSRGFYQISFFGEALLERLTTTFIQAKVREQEKLVHLFNLIGKKMEYIDEETLMSQEISNKILKIRYSSRVIQITKLGCPYSRPLHYFHIRYHKFINLKLVISKNSSVTYSDSFF